MTPLDVALKWLSRSLGAISGVVMVLMAVHTVGDALSRFFFSFTLDGASEVVSFYYMVSLVFLPLIVVQKKREIIFVELFTSKFTVRTKLLMDSVLDLVLCGYLIFFILISTEQALRKMADSEQIETATSVILIWPCRWLLPIGMSAMALICVLQAVRGFQMVWRNPERVGATQNSH